MAINYRDYSVLVVDDEDFARDVVRKLLGHIGIHRIHEAADGRKGLLELLRIKPSVVLCDVQMTPIDGRQFLKTLRDSKVAGISATPVIFLTADSKPDTVMFAKEYSADGYLVKPISLIHLKQRLDMVFARISPDGASFEIADLPAGEPDGSEPSA
ncbi:MAG: response regulator [Rhodospirillaceae bacterium]